MTGRLFLLLSMPLLSGCLPYVKDITFDPTHARYQGNYRPDAVYRLVQDAVIARFQPVGAGTEFSSVPRHALYPNVDSARNSAVSVPFAVSGVMPAGTKLQFKMLLYNWYFEGATTYPIVVAMDGPHAGMQVDVRKISLHEWATTSHSERYLQDERWLARVPP